MKKTMIMFLSYSLRSVFFRTHCVSISVSHFLLVLNSTNQVRLAVKSVSDGKVMVCTFDWEFHAILFYDKINVLIN